MRDAAFLVSYGISPYSAASFHAPPLAFLAWSWVIETAASLGAPTWLADVLPGAWQHIQPTHLPTTVHPPSALAAETIAALLLHRLAHKLGAPNPVIAVALFVFNPLQLLSTASGAVGAQLETAAVLGIVCGALSRGPLRTGAATALAAYLSPHTTTLLVCLNYAAATLQQCIHTYSFFAYGVWTRCFAQQHTEKGTAASLSALNIAAAHWG